MTDAETPLPGEAGPRPWGVASEKRPRPPSWYRWVDAALKLAMYAAFGGILVAVMWLVSWLTG